MEIVCFGVLVIGELELIGPVSTCGRSGRTCDLSFLEEGDEEG